MNDQKMLLILEDDKGLREVLCADFEDKGYRVTQAASLNDIPNIVFNFAILDLRLSGESGLSAIAKLKSLSINCVIVILTGYGSIATAVEAVKLGAANYLTKPANSEQIEEIFLQNSLDYISNTSKHSEKYKRSSLSQNEHEYINYVLNANAGNISKTARELGLHRQSLQRKLKKYP